MFTAPYNYLLLTYAIISICVVCVNKIRAFVTLPLQLKRIVESSRFMYTNDANN